MFLFICLTQMLFEEKILYSRSVSKQRNRKTLNSVIHSLKETRKTRFGGIKHSWREFKAMQALFNKKDNNFSQMKLGLLLTLVMLRTSAFNIPVFYPLSWTDGNKVPNSQWLSKRFRHLPHTCSGLLSPCYFQLWQTAYRLGDSICHFAVSLQFALT